MEDSSMQGMKSDSETGAKHKAGKSKVVDERPSKLGRRYDGIPCGIEVLVKKASVDPEFRTLLLEKRSDAAQVIDLELSAAEVVLLDSIPSQQIEKIIENTTVPDEDRRVFVGKVAAAMLTLTGAAFSSGCGMGIWPDPLRNVKGINPDRPPDDPKKPKSSKGKIKRREVVTLGIQPDQSREERKKGTSFPKAD